MKKMLDSLASADEALRQITQSVYDFLLDWTGVYVATLVAFVICGISGVYLYREETPLADLNTLLLAKPLFDYDLQKRKKYEEFNAQAREWVNSRLRPFVWGVISVEFVADVTKYFPATTILLSLWALLLGVQIRERRPRSLFPAREPVAEGA